MSVDHYENFPVASVLLPRRLRPAVVALYRYARSADDIADEGPALPAARLTELAGYRSALQAIERGDHSTPAPASVFGPLQQTIATYALPLAPLHRLLDAFEYDVRHTRHADFASLLNYCALSANPVGELMLHLYGALDERNLAASDDICTGLQLTNFCQDVALDWQKGRVYIPLQDLAQHEIEAGQLPAANGSAAWRGVMAIQVERARQRLLRGAPLALALPGRIGWELRLVVCGGLRILDRIVAAGYDVFNARPTLRHTDWLALAGCAFTYRHATRAQTATS